MLTKVLGACFDHRKVSNELAPFVKRRPPVLGDPATSSGLRKERLATTMRLVENTFAFTKGQKANTASATIIFSTSNHVLHFEGAQMPRRDSRVLFSSKSRTLVELPPPRGPRPLTKPDRSLIFSYVMSGESDPPHPCVSSASIASDEPSLQSHPVSNFPLFEPLSS